jgi:hypothetical protein
MWWNTSLMLLESVVRASYLIEDCLVLPDYKRLHHRTWG